MDSDKRMFLKQDLEAAGLNETEIENELFEFDRRQEYPLEDIYEKIDEIVNGTYFNLRGDFIDDSHDSYYCLSCDGKVIVNLAEDISIQNETVENMKHYNCELEELRSLVNTLGDMIA